MAQHLRVGNAAERHAESYLVAQGFEILERNFRCKVGEIDLIMKDQSDLVFVEVRYRRSDHYGDPAESIDGFKQRKLRLAAETWLQQHEEVVFRGCRFDVVSVSGSEDAFKVEWINDAF